ncbi:MAG: hypothetical protein JWQ18_2197 [Conexibacter sp.]|nr:hypothetical protein [Conexibacter sp.]
MDGEAHDRSAARGVLRDPNAAGGVGLWAQRLCPPLHRLAMRRLNDHLVGIAARAAP